MGLSERGDDGCVGVYGGWGEMGEDEEMLRARMEAALRTAGGE